MEKVQGTGITTILLTSMLTIMVGSAIAPSLMEINHHLDFQFDPDWLITLPSLGVVVFSPFVGRIINRLGSFKLLCWGLVPYALLGYMGGYLGNSYLLIVDRFLLGGSAVAIQVAATSLIAENFQGKQRLKVIAWQGMAIEGGGVIFLTLGGMLGEWYWRYPFMIYLLALIFLVMAIMSLPHRRVEIKHDEGTTSHDPVTRSKMVYVIFAASMLAMVIFFVSFVNLPQYLPTHFSFSESETGYLLASISLIAVISASQLSRVTNWIGSGFTVALGFLFFAFAYGLLAIASHLTLLLGTALLMGIGFGFTIPTLNHMMVEMSHERHRGQNLGLYSMGVFGGQFLSTFWGFLFIEKTLFFSTALLSLGVSIILAFIYRKNRALH